MRWLASRRVGTKLSFIVGILAAIAIAIGALGIFRLHQVQDAGDRIYQDALVPIDEADDLKAQFYLWRLTNLGHQTAPDAAGRAKVEATAKEVAAEMAQNVDRYDEVDGGRSGSDVEKVHGLIDQYQSLIDNEYFPASRAENDALAQQIRDEKITPISKQLMVEIDEMIDIQKKHAEVVRADAQRTYESARTVILVVLLVGLAVGFVLAVLVSRQIVRPLNEVRKVAEGLAEGNLSRSAGVHSADEVGQVAQALDRAMATLRSVVGEMDASSRQLSEASEQLTGVSGNLAASAEEGSAQASTVSAASEQVTRNIDTVAAGSEEMSASIREIASSAAEAAKVSLGAVDLARDTTTTVRKLGESSTQIGDVVKVITAIAAQTNLLALNATIEAARAGDAGKGFAVVASEVKDLAQETAKATEDIARRVEQIQADTGGAVGAIGEIAAVIGTINDHATGIAAAVEEQSATTGEMSRNVAEAATGVTQISENVTGVAVVAQATTDGANQAKQAAHGLSEMSVELRHLVGRFRL